MERTRSRNTMLILIGAATLPIAGSWALVRGGVTWLLPALAGVACLIAGTFSVPDRKHSQRAVVGLVAVAAVTLAILISNELGHWPRRPIRVILPTGYAGEFSLIKDVKRGRPLVVKDGAWTFEIPRDGVLRVEDTWPFFVPHRDTYVFEDGTPARVTSLGSFTPPMTRGSSSNRDDGSLFKWRVEGPP